MAFIYKGSRNPNGGRMLVDLTLTDSDTYTIGDAVKVTSGKLVLWGLAGAGYGILAGIKKANGSPVADNGAGADYDDTYTTGGSNTVVGSVDVSTESIYSVAMDATLGSTPGSDIANYNVDCLAASDELDETSTVTGTASFHIWGQDPDGSAASNSVLVSIQESTVKI